MQLLSKTVFGYAQSYVVPVSNSEKICKLIFLSVLTVGVLVSFASKVLYSVLVCECFLMMQVKFLKGVQADFDFCIFWILSYAVPSLFLVVYPNYPSEGLKWLWEWILTICEIFFYLFCFDGEFPKSWIFFEKYFF